MHYVNTGDWVEHCSAVVETQQGELHLLNWTEDSLHWLDRSTAPAATTEPAFAKQAGG